MSKKALFDAKRQAYLHVKEQTSKTHLFKKTAMKGFFDQAQATYRWRMDATVSQTKDLDVRLRELERQES